MLPISLKFSGLNSYRTEESLDFSPMSTAGVFGIFGPTGAGKSTVLDAITLALYGEVTRSKNSARGAINMSEKQAKVCFAFKLGESSYEVQRVLVREKGKEFSARVKSCRLTRLDDQVVLASDKVDEVNRAIIDLIGLRSEDFLRSVALPQGQFDKFLRLGASERGKMLEHLFGLEQYGVALQEKLKNYLDSLEQTKTNNLFKLEQIGDCSPERLANQTEILQGFDQELVQVKTTLQRENEALQKWEILNTKFEEYKNNLTKQEELQKAEPQQAELKAELQMAQKTEILRRQINQIQVELGKIKTLQSQTQQAKSQLAALQTQQQTLEQTQTNLNKTRAENYETWLQNLQKLETAQEQTAKAQAVKKQFEDSEKTAQLLQTQAADLKNQQNQLKGKIEANQEAKATIAKEIEAHKNHVMAKNLAGILGAKLEANQPCPVCGSLNHPQICLDTAPNPEISFGEIENEKLQAEGKKLEQEQEALHKQTLLLTGKIAANAADLANFKHNLADFGELTESKVLAKKIAEINELKTNLLQSESQTKAQLAEIKPQFDTTTTQYNLLLGQMQSTETAFDELKTYLSQACTKLGFQSVNQAKLALRSSEEQENLATSIKNHEQNAATVSANLKTLKSQLQNNYQSEQGSTLKASIKICEEAQAQLFGKIATTKQLATTISQNQELWQQLLAANQLLAAKTQTAQELQKLIKGGALVNFLAEEYLNQVLVGANAYLATFSNGRYGLELEGQSQGNSKDFMLKDSFNGNQTRPINTMSGGEIFLASLAMALALSTHIQLHGKYELGFFFLDEGFGTLDSDKLETLMSAIEKLPAGGRLVGIITHVPEVKNRLPYYWEITPATGTMGSQITWHTN